MGIGWIMTMMFEEDQLYNFSELCDIILGLKQLKIKVQTYEGNRKETSTSTHVACEVKGMSDFKRQKESIYLTSYILVKLKLVKCVNKSSDLTIDVCDEILNLQLGVQELNGLSVGVIANSKRS